MVVLFFYVIKHFLHIFASMNKEQALYCYPKLKKIISEYEDADKFFYINEDPDLIPIKIPLPEPPDWELIKNFGLPRNQQVWSAPKMPKALVKLQKECETIEAIWDRLQKEQHKYQKEIEFIKEQWYYRIHGCWCFIDGKPTYISKDHWLYISWWKIDFGIPEYRERDRKMFLAESFLENSTYDFKNKDKDGNAIANENGEYEMYDTGRKVFIGIVYVKYRREGATYKAGLKNFNTISLSTEAIGGIQSRNEDDAKKVFQIHIVRPYKKIPFFFKPMTSGSTEPTQKLSFDKSAQRMKGSTIANIITGLESYITYESGTEGAFDGYKLQFYHCDEVGKVEGGIDINVRHNIAMECLSENMGMKRVGWSWYTSTVGEMTGGGGEQFFQLCKNSNYYVRNENGRTITGLVTLFIPSDEGLILDKFGNSKKKESRKFIENERTGRILAGDLIGWNEKVRHYPLSYQECFIPNAKENGMNIYIITQRIAEMRNTEKKMQREGYFEWVGERLKSDVRWVDTVGITPKFHISLTLDSNMANRRELYDGQFRPIASKFIAGADPFKHGKNTTNRVSDGAGAVFWLKDHENPDSYRFVCDYLYRTKTVEEYCEDMLKMCIYYGAMVFPENNFMHVEEFFALWGYRGYLLYEMQPNGKMRKNAGFYSNEESKQDIYNLNIAYIEEHGMRERHYRYLKQCKDIRGIDDLTNNDLIAAAGAALRGVKLVTRKEVFESQAKVDLEISNYFKSYSY